MSDIHLRYNGRPACGCHGRWGSSTITTTASIAKVTCRRCLAMTNQDNTDSHVLKGGDDG